MADTALPAAPPVRGHNTIVSLSPFGLGHDKPRDYRALVRALWSNRWQLPFAWRVLNEGVCDGCDLGPRGLHDDVVGGLHLCPESLQRLEQHTAQTLVPADLVDLSRLQAMDERALRDLGRLSYPFVWRRGDRGLAKATWDDALAAVAAARPEGLSLHLGDVSAEACYAAAKTARLLGSDDLHSAASAGLPALVDGLGSDAPSCSLVDLVHTDLVLVVGEGPGPRRQALLRYLARAKCDGTRVVVVASRLGPGLDASWEPGMFASAVFGTRVMDDFVHVSPGGEGAFLAGVLKVLVHDSTLDREFVRRHTSGWDELRDELAELSFERLVELCGVPKRDMEWVAQILVRAPTAVTLLDAQAAAPAVLALHLARGLIGRPGCGVIPLSPPGSQDAGALGAQSGVLPGGHTPQELAELWGAPVELKGDPGELALCIAGGAGSGRVAVHADSFLSPAMFHDPGELLVLLPLQTRHEQTGGSVRTSLERRIRYSPRLADGPENTRPAWQVPGLLGRRLRPDLDTALHVVDAEQLRRELGRVVPRYRGIETFNRAGDWLQWGGPQLFGGGAFLTPDGLARFAPKLL